MARIQDDTERDVGRLDAAKPVIQIDSFGHCRSG